MFLFDYVLLALSLIFSVAFITLLERKLLGYMQLRKGPNKPSLKGLATPASDALKLMSKNPNTPWSANPWGFLLSPVLSLILFLSLLMSVPSCEFSAWSSLSLLLFLSILSWNVYPLFFSGWSSNSAYAFLGSARGISQTISYEISLSFLALSLVIVPLELSFFWVASPYYTQVMFLAVMPLSLLWFFTSVAETNRAPFDFSESESELVSGFNIEYGGMKFALIFLSEYGMILVLSLLLVFLSGIGKTSTFLGFMSSCVPVVLWVWIRATFPRYRYDKLMGISWKCILPIALSLCFYSLALFSFSA